MVGGAGPTDGICVQATKGKSKQSMHSRNIFLRWEPIAKQGVNPKELKPKIGYGVHDIYIYIYPRVTLTRILSLFAWEPWPWKL